jgi:hypothetical protein
LPRAMALAIFSDTVFEIEKPIPQPERRRHGHIKIYDRADLAILWILWKHNVMMHVSREATKCCDDLGKSEGTASSLANHLTA